MQHDILGCDAIIDAIGTLEGSGRMATLLRLLDN